MEEENLNIYDHNKKIKELKELKNKFNKIIIEKKVTLKSIIYYMNKTKILNGHPYDYSLNFLTEFFKNEEEILLKSKIMDEEQQFKKLTKKYNNSIKQLIKQEIVNQKDLIYNFIIQKIPSLFKIRKFSNITKIHEDRIMIYINENIKNQYSIKKYVSMKNLDLFQKDMKIIIKSVFEETNREKLLEFLNNEFERIINNEDIMTIIINENIKQLNLSYMNKKEIVSHLLLTINYCKDNLSELDNNINIYLNDIITEDEIIKMRKLSEIKELKTKATLTNIEEFYYLARQKKRKMIAYLGPTNSGKTHSALKEFEKSKNGVYLAPLRLLAREIFDDKKDKLNMSLITGEEVIKNEFETHVSSTIEMLDITKEYDIALIDEIQMLEDTQRGNAWSRALMGVNAKTIIVIGSIDSQYLIEKIAEKCGDTLEIKKFNRLGKLVINKNFIKLNQLEKGDAVICFSRKSIHSFKEKIEDMGFSTSVVYGALPPETRLRQAESFNNGETDILIATNAIGFGLNLSIKRILFSTVSKYNGVEVECISQSEFLQISGRAGRFGKFDVGEVNYLNHGAFWQESDLYDYKRLVNDSSKQLENIECGFYFPELEHLKEFSKMKDFDNNLHSIINEYSKYFLDTSNTFLLSSIDDFYYNSKIIDRVSPKMDIEEKYRYSFAPLPKETQGENIFIDYIKLLFLDNTKSISFYNYYSRKLFIGMYNLPLETLEEIAKDSIIYLWLMNRKDKKNKKDFSDIEEIQFLYNKISIEIDKQLKNN